MSKKYSSMPANITEHVDRNVHGTFAGAGHEEIIPAPGLNQRLIVTSFIISNRDAQTATTVSLQDGGHDHWAVYLAATQFISKDFPANHPWKLSAHRPLSINADAAVTVLYSIQYHVEAR